MIHVTCSHWIQILIRPWKWNSVETFSFEAGRRMALGTRWGGNGDWSWLFAEASLLGFLGDSWAGCCWFFGVGFVNLSVFIYQTGTGRPFSLSFHICIYLYTFIFFFPSPPPWLGISHLVHFPLWRFLIFLEYFFFPLFCLYGSVRLQVAWLSLPTRLQLLIALRSPKSSHNKS